MLLTSEFGVRSLQHSVGRQTSGRLASDIYTRIQTNTVQQQIRKINNNIHILYVILITLVIKKSGVKK